MVSLIFFFWLKYKIAHKARNYERTEDSWRLEKNNKCPENKQTKTIQQQANIFAQKTTNQFGVMLAMLRRVYFLKDKRFKRKEKKKKSAEPALGSTSSISPVGFANNWLATRRWKGVIARGQTRLEHL